LLVGIATLVTGATDKERVEKAQVFFSKSGSLSHKLHYSNIKQDFDVRGLYETIEKVRTAVRAKSLTVHFVQPLQNNESRSGHFLEDPTLDNRQKVAHRVEYCLNALLSRVTRLVELFKPVDEHIEEFKLKNKEEAADFIFHHGHRLRRQLLVSHKTSSWARIHPEWIYPLRVKRIEPISVMIAIVTAIIAASVVTIFTAVELEKLKAEQQKADIEAKQGLMASKEILNSQLELIRLTSEVIGSLEKYWSNIDTIQHVLLVSAVTDRQVSMMELVMQAAMGGHMSVVAFTEMHYARIAMKISRKAKDAGLQPVAKHFSYYLQMETSFVAGPDGFSTLVHVPLIDMKSALTIWEHHILPIPLQEDLYLNIGPAEYTHLAVTADHKLYRAMTRAEFNTCRRLGEFYFCDRSSSLPKHQI
jgi:hypothetical protein